MGVWPFRMQQTAPAILATMTNLVARLAVLLCLPLASCGGGGSSTPTNPTPPINPSTFTISSTGVTPKEMTVSPGARVLFVNNDSRRHDMTSDPHPEHDACPEINAVGVLTPGQNRETLNLVAVNTCGFHDHENPDNANLRGRIIIR
jgi:plastocyanin